MATSKSFGVPAEIITVAAGQAGLQMSNGLWELLCLEHGVTPNGRFLPSIDPQLNADISGLEKFDVFFYGAASRQIVPRAVLVDLEATVVDEIRTGTYRDLFHPCSIVNGMEDAANNFARGHFTQGKNVLNRVMDEIRKQANRCDSLQGFSFINGMGGGTGSGFCCLVLEKINTEFTKHTKMMMNIFPGTTMSTSTVEYYNTALAMHTIVEHADLNITLDNEALYKIAINHLGFQRPTYNDINRLMAQITSSVTCSLRFPCSLNCDMNQLQTNLVPFPRIHFPISCYSPLVSNFTVNHETLDIRQLVKDLFDDQSRLVSIAMTEGRYMACNVIFRGNVSPKDVNTGISEIKRSSEVEFVDWCPTSFKVGICSQPPLAVPASGLARTNRCCSLLANNTAIGEKWKNLLGKFDQLYNKRAFVHWFVGEGMEEGELTEARSDVVTLVADYDGAGKNSSELAGGNASSAKSPDNLEEANEQPDEIGIPPYEAYSRDGGDGQVGGMASDAPVADKGGPEEAGSRVDEPAKEMTELTEASDNESVHEQPDILQDTNQCCSVSQYADDELYFEDEGGIVMEKDRQFGDADSLSSSEVTNKQSDLVSSDDQFH